MIHFFSNHKDTKFIEELTGEEVRVIAHPYVEPEWSESEVAERCAAAIEAAVSANKLIINGDYFLVSHIVLSRSAAGKKTGFLAMKKFNEPSNEKDREGRIVHRNILKPVAIRWI